MIPIYEQGNGRGIGYNFESFIKRFDEICASHSDRSFSFIFYDFKDDSLKTILKDQGVFAALDRLSGSELDIFYLHGGRNDIKPFNDCFRKKIGVKYPGLPCVAFFRWKEEAFTDVSVVPLENTDLIHGLHELYTVIEAYKKREPHQTLKYLRWLPSALQFLTRETLKAALREVFDRLPM
jgi:hypothetical protein